VRIGIDGRELEGKPTGVGRYLMGLLRTWLDSAGDDVFVVFHRERPTVELPASPRIEWRRLGSGSTPDTWWQQIVLARALRHEPVDVLFAPSDSMPLMFKGPSVVTVHDLSYFAHPEWFRSRHGARRRWLTRMAARRATRMIAVSEFTARELVLRFDLPATRVQVIHHGCDEHWLTTPFTPEAELRERIGFDGPFALVVGSIFERRGTDRIVEALSLLDGVDLGLVIVGEDRRRSGEDLDAVIGAHGLERRATWLRYATDRDLAGLYRTAQQLIYLSSYEGFGLPPLEAMALGTPAMVSDAPALNEIYRDSALLVPGFDPPTIAGAMRRLACDPDLREELRRKGHELAERLSLAVSAAKTLELIREAGRNS